jgi:hypothetical protein
MKFITCPHCGETYRNITAVHVCSSGPYAVKLQSDTNTNSKERIRELARDAGFTSNDDQEVFLRVYEQELKKFAELIVRECADLYNHDDVLAPIGMSAWGEAHQHGWIEGTQAYRDTILEHFGVKE